MEFFELTKWLQTKNGYLTNKNKPVNISEEAKNKIESSKEGEMNFRN